MRWKERNNSESTTTSGWNNTQPAGSAGFSLIGEDCIILVVPLLCVGHPSQVLCVCVCVCVTLGVGFVIFLFTSMVCYTLFPFLAPSFCVLLFAAILQAVSWESRHLFLKNCRFIIHSSFSFCYAAQLRLLFTREVRFLQFWCLNCKNKKQKEDTYYQILPLNVNLLIKQSLTKTSPVNSWIFSVRVSRAVVNKCGKY